MTSDNSSKGANAHIEEYLDYYCNLSNPKFAVLLKGSWGSGKTWLIKKFMKDFQARKDSGLSKSPWKAVKMWLAGNVLRHFKLKKTSNLSSRNTYFLYVSLYGMQTLEEIEREFLRQLHPVLGSHEVEFLAKSISTVIPLHLNSFLDNLRVKSGLTLKNLPGYLKNVGQRILVFDDLERCHVNINYVLGYVNSFVEHKSARVIIIANEEELHQSYGDESQNQERKHQYKCIKEKIIGQTLEVKFSFQETIESLMRDLCKYELIKNEEIEFFIKSQSETIEIIYQHAEYKNIRTLRKIILDFNRIWVSLPANVIQKEEAIQEIFKLLIIFSIEISLGNIDFIDLAKICDQYEKFHMQKRMSSGSHEPKTKIHKLIKKYNFLHQTLSYGNNLFPIDSWWVEFLGKSTLNQEYLNDSIKRSRYFRDETTPAWLKLYSYQELQDYEFSQILQEVEDQFLEQKIHDLGEAIYIFGVILELSNHNLTDISLQDLQNSMISFIDKSRENGCFLDFARCFTSGDFERLGLSIRGKSHDGFREIDEYITQCKKKDEEIFFKKSAEELLEMMISQNNEFHSQLIAFIKTIENPSSTAYRSVPILKYIDTQEFTIAFVSLPPLEQSKVLNTIIKRHDNDRHSELLREEYEWIEKVITSLKNEQEKRQKDRLLSGLLLSEVIENFEKNIEILISFQQGKPSL
ncbi:P-loop NTPase fold protein [Limnothrix redekei]|uniref:P-loop NTPase fold protein n=1 Tax=Limnothrix redekei LRLZ20PSL1 TaxID=3112953 RepID=A0ABW7C8C4_9CYAN